MAAVPYLGCKISLVSKSEIRYEGILYAIDAKESTVALAKVKSFGTEERPTDRPVAPHNEIYEYIIFRASDIKDLQVSEAPKPQPVLNASGLPNDPAIVQVFHSTSLQPCQVSYAQQPFGHVCGVPTYQHYPSQVSYSHMSSLFPASHGSRYGTSHFLRKSPTMDAGVQVQTESLEKSSASSLQEQSSRNLRDARQTASAPQLQRQSSLQSNRQMQRGRGSMRRMRRGRGGTGMPVRMKFDSEYDFEQANAEFQELETRLAKAKLDDSGNETLGGDTEDEVIGYDRQKSFFDNISCEASRVAKGIPRFDWRIERKLNVETFGVSMSNAWFRRRRGRGGFRRGGRGRGIPPSAAASATTTSVAKNGQKTVTFGADTLVTVETKEPIVSVEDPPVEENVKIEDIPTIEIVVEKDPKKWEGNAKIEDIPTIEIDMEKDTKDWEGGAAGDGKEQWN